MENILQLKRRLPRRKVGLVRRGLEGTCVAGHATSSLTEDFSWSLLVYRKESLATVSSFSIN